MSTFTLAPSVLDFDIPLSALQNRDENIAKRLVVGVAIVRQSAALPQVLLLQRAAHEAMFPDMYELPGGKCEKTDNTLLDTVVREAFEETGFRVSHILAEFPGFVYSTPKGESRQYNFIVELGGEDSAREPILDPNEHQAFAWADKNQVETLPISDAMRQVVADALRASAKLSDH